METDNSKIWKYTTAFGLSLAVSSVVSALLVVAKELSPNTIMPWMKRLTGQHWVTHSLLMVLLFAILGVLLANTNLGQGVRTNGKRLVGMLVAGVIIGYLIIAGFYLIEG